MPAKRARRDADTLDGIEAADLTPTGYLYGGVIVNATGDADNDLTISSGTCRNDSDTTTIRVAAMTKRVDAVWSAGTGQGGLDAGTIGSAEVMVYIWAIGDSAGTRFPSSIQHHSDREMLTLR